VAAPYELILDATLGMVEGLKLAYGSDPLAVVRRKLPEVREDIDVVPAVYVCPHQRAEGWKRWCSEGWVRVAYLVSIVGIAASNRDAVSNLGDPLTWRKRIADAFSGPNPMPTVPTFHSLEVVHEVPLDRKAFENLYDLSAMALRVFSLEQTGG
jgi:hypothetical protein